MEFEAQVSMQRSHTDAEKAESRLASMKQDIVEHDSQVNQVSSRMDGMEEFVQRSESQQRHEAQPVERLAEELRAAQVASSDLLAMTSDATTKAREE